MPRVTRRSLAAAEGKEEKPEPAPTRSRGRRGAKAAEPEDTVDEPQESPAKGRRGARAKEPAPKAEAPRGRASSRSTGRGRGKVEVEPPEEDVEEEEEKITPKRGSRGRGRGGRGRSRGRSSRGKAAAEEEEEEMEDEDETPKAVEAKPASGGRGRGRSKAVEAEASGESKEAPEEVKTTPRGRQRKTPSKPEPTPPSSGKRRSGRRGQVAEEAAPEEEKGQAEKAEEAMEEEEPEAEQKAEDNKPTTAGFKRKHEEDKSDKGLKRARLSDSTPATSAAEAPKEKTTDELADFVVVSKDDVPAADSKEVTESLPPAKKTEEPAEKEKVEDSKKETEASGESSKIPASEESQKENNEQKSQEPMEAETTQETEKMDVEETKPPKETAKELESAEGKESTAPAEAPAEPPKATPVEPPKQVPSKSTPVESPKQAPPKSTPVEPPKKAPTEPPKSVAPVEPPKEVPSETKTGEVSNQPVVKEAAAPEIPSVVPLTEAELAKQYNPTTRDRDETSSTLVEVGSETTSDAMSTTRNLDVSDAVSMDATTSEPTNDESSVSSVSDLLPSKSTESVQAPKVSSGSVNETLNNSVYDIPLPSQSSSATPAVSAVNSNPPQQQPVAEVSLNSIPLPPSFNASSTGTAASQLSAPPPSSSTTPSAVPPNPTTNTTIATQNGSVQSTPLHTSTPAKRPTFASLEGYVPSSTSIDKRKFIINPNFPIELFDTAFCFSVVSYNILADCHLRRNDYSYTEPQYLDLSYRHKVLTQELEYLDGDIVCLQEVGPAYYNDVLLPYMKSKGYQGLFMKRIQDWYDEGEATFVKSSKFDILSHQGLSFRDLAYKEIDSGGLSEEVTRAAKKYLDRSDVIVLSKLLSKKTGKTLTLCNIHVVWDLPSPDVQCMQVACAIKELVALAGSDLNPYIICGDFNSEVTSPAYHLVKEGYLSDAHIRNLQALEKMDNKDGSSRSLINHLWRAFQHTSSNLKSAYETAVGKEPALTSLTKVTHAAFDYIFFSASSLYTVGALEAIDQQVLEATGGLPSKNIPSDHISMKAVFRLKD